MNAHQDIIVMLNGLAALNIAAKSAINGMAAPASKTARARAIQPAIMGTGIGTTHAEIWKASGSSVMEAA